MNTAERIEEARKSLDLGSLMMLAGTPAVVGTGFAAGKIIGTDKTISAEDIRKLRAVLSAKDVPLATGGVSPAAAFFGPHYMPPENYALSQTLRKKLPWFRDFIPTAYAPEIEPPKYKQNPTLDAMEAMGFKRPYREMIAPPKIDEDWLRAAKKHGYIHHSGGYIRPEVLAHEFGHASGLGKSELYRKLIMPARGLSVLGLPAAAVAGYMGADADDTRGGAALRGGLYGAGAGAVASSPVLFEEARASYRALKGLRELGVPFSRIIKALARLSAGFGSYLALATIPTAAIGATAGMIGRIGKTPHAKKEKKAFDLGRRLSSARLKGEP